MSTGNKPDLVIPIEFDYAKALQQLADLKKQAESATAAIKTGMNQAAEAVKPVEEHALNLGKIFGVSLTSGAAALSAAAIASLRSISEEITRSVKAFTEYNAAQQGLAAMSGRANRASFNVEQANLAVGAAMAPMAWTQFQDTFQAFAQQYISGDGMKLTSADEATKYQQQLAMFASSRNIPASEIAQLGGGVLANATEKLTADQAMQRVGRQFSVLEQSPINVKENLPLMTRLTAGGTSGDEAAQLLGLFSDIQPGEQGTYARRTLDALNEMIIGGKGETLGINSKMSSLTKLRTAAQSIFDQVQGGGDLEKILYESGFRGVDLTGMRGAVTRGIGMGGFDAQARFLANADPGFTQKSIDEYLSNPTGQGAMNEARRQFGLVSNGALHMQGSLARQQAEADLTVEGAFERGNLYSGLADALSSTIGNNSQFLKLLPIASGRDQLINYRAAQNLRRQTGAWQNPVTNILDAAASIDDYGAIRNLDRLSPSVPRGSASDELVKLMQRTATATEATAKAAATPKTLSAPPPNPVTRTP